MGRVLALQAVTGYVTEVCVTVAYIIVGLSHCSSVIVSLCHWSLCHYGSVSLGSVSLGFVTVGLVFVDLCHCDLNCCGPVTHYHVSSLFKFMASVSHETHRDFMALSF